MIVKTKGRLPGKTRASKFVAPRKLKIGPKGLMPGSRMQITRRTSAGPVTAPGMKYSRRNADENRPGRMSRRSASRTTNPMPSGTETIRNSRRFPNTWKNRASP